MIHFPDNPKIEMELLCSLGPTPVPMELLVIDFAVLGIESQADIVNALRPLDKLGVKFERHNKDGERLISIAPSSWYTAKTLCNEYLRQIEAEPGALEMKP